MQSTMKTAPSAAMKSRGGCGGFLLAPAFLEAELARSKSGGRGPLYNLFCRAQRGKLTQSSSFFPNTHRGLICRSSRTCAELMVAQIKYSIHPDGERTWKKA